jgi:hypothetical protein
MFAVAFLGGAQQGVAQTTGVNSVESSNSGEKQM